MPDRASEVRWQTLQSLRKEGVRLTGEGTRRQFRSRKPFSAICTLEQRVSAKSPTRQSPSTGPPHGQHSSTEAPKSESPVRESFWPTLRRHILGKTNTTRPVRASCPICLDDVSIAGLPPPQMDDPDGKVCQIAPCGHIFCRRCLRMALAAQTADAARTCPVCRLPLSCRQCGTITKLATAPQDPSAAASLVVVPLTIPEGARFEDLCARCVSRGRWMQRVWSGRWPEGAAQLEVGFVPFLFTTLDALEDARRERSVEAVLAVFRTVLEDEFDDLDRARERFIAEDMRRWGQVAADAYQWL